MLRPRKLAEGVDREIRFGFCLLLAIALPACQRKAPEGEPTLTVLLPGDILVLNPNREMDFATDAALFNVYEPLVGLSDGLEIQRILAESWEHPRPEQWRFHLRKNVRFHDGTPLTAALVKDAFLNPDLGPVPEMAEVLQHIQEIVAVDEHTLDIITRKPRAILASLSYLYVVKPNAHGTNPPVVGTGPYRIREWVRNQRLVLQAFPDHRDAPVAFKNVIMVPVADPSERVERLLKGGGDIAYNVEPGLIGQLPPGFRIVHEHGLTVFYLGFHLHPRPDNPFRDVRVRQAVNIGIDRQRVIERHVFGYGLVASQPIAPLVFGYSPDIPPPVYDRAQARRLLAEAGYPNGFRVPLHVMAGRGRLGQTLSDELKQIGIQLDVEVMPKDAFWSYLRQRQSLFFAVAWVCSTGEASEFFEYNLHTRSPRYGRGNYGEYSNAVIDQIVETNASVLDPKRRRSMLEQAGALVMRELPVVPLYVEDELFLAREGLDFTLRADGEVRLKQVRPVQRH